MTNLFTRFASAILKTLTSNFTVLGSVTPTYQSWNVFLPKNFKKFITNFKLKKIERKKEKIVKYCETEL